MGRSLIRVFILHYKNFYFQDYKSCLKMIMMRVIFSLIYHSYLEQGNFQMNLKRVIYHNQKSKKNF